MEIIMNFEYDFSVFRNYIFIAFQINKILYDRYRYWLFFVYLQFYYREISQIVFKKIKPKNWHYSIVFNGASITLKMILSVQRENTSVQKWKLIYLLSSTMVIFLKLDSIKYLLQYIFLEFTIICVIFIFIFYSFLKNKNK